jgi:hypothetical protein
MLPVARTGIPAIPVDEHRARIERALFISVNRVMIRTLICAAALAWWPLHSGALAQCTFSQSSVPPQPLLRYRFTIHDVGDPGFDVRASVNARRVTGVRTGSAAAAGLRDGQPLLGWSIYNGDSDRPATFTIQGDSARQRISYYPRGTGALAPQLHIVDGYAPKPATCGLSIRHDTHDH